MRTLRRPAEARAERRGVAASWIESRSCYSFLWLLAFTVGTLTRAGQLSAQFVNGSADWSFGRSSFNSDGAETLNTSLIQNYTFAYRSVLWDPRFLQYAAGLSFSRAGLSFGDKKGRSNNTGFDVNANFFPARPFPLSIHARRSFGTESGSFPSSGTVRGGLPLPPGEIAPEIRGRMSSYGVTWNVDREGIPRIELTYRRDTATQAAGASEAEQRNTHLSLAATRETERTRSTLRFQRQAFDNAIVSEYRSRSNDLAYDLNATLGARTRGTFRAGYLDSYSLFDTPRSTIGIGGGGAYSPSTKGGFKVFHTTASINHQVTDRLLSALTASYEHGRSSADSTNAIFLSSTSTYTILKGLSLNGRVSHGHRGQESQGETVNVRTRNLGGGFVYGLSLPHAQLGFGYDRERGWSQSVEGRAGASTNWTASANASTGVLKYVNLSASYERSRSRDDLLRFGNFATDRMRASAQSQRLGPTRLLLNWERSETKRGPEGSFVRSSLRAINGEMQIQLGRRRRVSVIGGEFANTSEDVSDLNRYVGLDFESYELDSLAVTFTVRRESHKLERYLDQSGIRIQGRVDYQLRAFTFGIEYRYTDLRQVIAARGEPYDFSGNQFLVRVTRKFGFYL